MLFIAYRISNLTVVTYQRETIAAVAFGPKQRLHQWQPKEKNNLVGQHCCC